MINPLRLAESYIHRVEPGDNAERIFALIPVVNNIFLEVKRLQLEESDSPKLKKIARTVSFWFWGQVIWAPLLAKVMVCLSFKWRTTTLILFTFYSLALDKYIEWIKGPN